MSQYIYNDEDNTPMNEENLKYFDELDARARAIRIARQQKQEEDAECERS